MHALLSGGEVYNSLAIRDRHCRYPGCDACAAVCPDFVFEVWKFDTPVQLPTGPVPESALHREVEAFKDDVH